MQDHTVLYVGGFELPDKNAAAHRVLANAKILRELGYRVCLIGIDKTLPKKTDPEPTEKQVEGFSYYRIGYPKSLADWLSYLTSISNIRRLKKIRPSYIIAYNYPAVALYRLLKYGRANGIKIISDCTEWYQPVGNPVFRSLKRWDTELRMKKIHPRLDGMIVISKFLYEYYAGKQKPVLYLPPLVDKMQEKWKRENEEKPGEEIVLTYAGSPGSGKKDRLDRIIRVLYRIRTTSGLPVFLNMIGMTREQYMRVFDGEAGDTIDSFVRFHGRLSHAETLAYIKNSDYEIFVRENSLVNTAGFPTKFVESISCGTPVLTNLSSNLGDYLKNGENGYILDIGNEDTLTDTLHTALSQPREKIEAMKRNCRADDRFDYRYYLSRCADFLKNV